MRIPAIAVALVLPVTSSFAQQGFPSRTVTVSAAASAPLVQATVGPDGSS
ncbi:MAG: hypothetical protein IT537_22325 [Hyphomicrobiales bacterium]|nr:hypothetical protein [Hyphomicrobiales bacterium]